MPAETKLTSEKEAEQTSTTPFARATAHAFLASALGVPVAFATSVLVARALGPSEKGIFDLAMATASFLSLALSLALPAGITYAVARGLAGPRTTARLSILIALVQGLAAFLVLDHAGDIPVIGSVVALGQSGSITLLVAAMVGVGSGAALFRAIAVGRGRIVSANWIDLAARALLLVVGFAVAVVLARGQSTASIFVGVSVAASLVGAAAMAYLGVSGSGAGGRIQIRAGLRIAVPAYLANILQFLNYRFDLYLVAYFMTAADVGFYALAASLGQMVWLVSNSIGAVLFPRVAAGKGDALADQTSQLARFALVSAFALGVALCLGSTIFVSLIYGNAFVPAIPALWLLMPGIVLFAPVNVIAAYLAGSGRPELNLVTSAASLVATLVLDLVLIPPYGIAGAAIATSASYLVAAVVIGNLFARHSKRSMSSAFWPQHGDFAMIRSFLTSKVRSKIR